MKGAPRSTRKSLRGKASVQRRDAENAEEAQRTHLDAEEAEKSAGSAHSTQRIGRYMEGIDIQAIVRQAVQEFVNNEQAKTEPAHKA